MKRFVELKYVKKDIDGVEEERTIIIQASRVESLEKNELIAMDDERDMCCYTQNEATHKENRITLLGIEE